MESMESDEESRMIMPKAQPAASELEIDESSRALDERSHHGANKPIWDLYANTNLCAAVRCLFSIPMLGSAARIVASTEPISTVFPFAAYALGCAILHVLLAAHRTVRPRSLTSALPSQLYMTIIAISPAALLAASLYGFTVLAMTREHYDERDPQGELVRCGSKYGSRKCRPKTHAADIYDMTIVCTSFAFAAL
ncbi:uncharacterized protein B0T15DRAFT_271817 [Chaetomium strumarium]|uniref:Uncharacterized protein n=1 Tax=Chaetomium strumarium TaxID=1170767 RepID=A0AAJ0GNR7_9PEZI|nr:hypothetical protein B0T15DRAFT_271817 [Chaetomium strumarium]